MKFENVKVRISTQVINIGQPERWNVIETTVLLEGDDTFEDALAEGMKKVNEGHEKYSKSFIEPTFEPKDKKQTFQDLKNELNATSK
jgi:hypothetical protein